MSRADPLRAIWAMSGTRRTTGGAIADAVPFNVIADDTIDLSIGEGAGFWTEYRPPRLVTNDAAPAVPADHHVDVQLEQLPYPARSFGTACWDPPYRMSGTSSKTGMAGDMNQRYGVDRYRPKREIWALYEAGIIEAVRLTRASGHIIVKCGDQTSSGAFQGQSHHVWSIAEKLGCQMEFILFVVAVPRAQPAGRGVQRLSANVSQLLVFEVPS